MTLTADAVFITPDIDHTTLTRDSLPAAPGMLPCGRCGEIRTDHAKSAPADCRDFVRPALPDGHAYADTLTRGMHIRRRSRPAHGSERIVALTGGDGLRTGQMMLLQTETATAHQSALAYLTPDVIVEVLDDDLPLGS